MPNLEGGMITRTCGIKLQRCGIDRNRYCELRYHCRQYKQLTRIERRSINEAANIAMGGEYAWALKRNVCENIPFKSIDAPFSEREFARRRKIFFIELDRILRERQRMQRSVDMQRLVRQVQHLTVSISGLTVSLQTTQLLCGSETM